LKNENERGQVGYFFVVVLGIYICMSSDLFSLNWQWESERRILIFDIAIIETERWRGYLEDENNIPITLQ